MIPARIQAAAAARLHPQWRLLMRRAWSFRFSIAAAVLSGFETALSILTDNPPISPRWFALLLFVVTVASAVARLVAQQNIPPSSGD